MSVRLPFFFLITSAVFGNVFTGSPGLFDNHDTRPRTILSEVGIADGGLNRFRDDFWGEDEPEEIFVNENDRGEILRKLRIEEIFLQFP